jgi:flagellar protein FliS
MVRVPDTNPYQVQQVESADKLKLVELLYEGALRFMRRAAEAIEQRDPEAAHHAILRAYAIVAELQATLDMEQGGSIAVNLERCYDFVLSRLKDANINKQLQPLDDAISVIEPLLSTWKQAHNSGSPERLATLPPGAGQHTPPVLTASGSTQPAGERLVMDVVG